MNNDDKLIDTCITIHDQFVGVADDERCMWGEIIQLVRDSEWRSVEDELPEDESYVQGYCDGELTKVYLGEVCYCSGKWIIFN